MKILFYGAGVLGSLYAGRLQERGHEVSVLARGDRLSQIREHGIVLEHGVTKDRTIARVNLVERLVPEDVYNLVVVPVGKHKVTAVLPALASNQHTPNVLFMCNNAAGPSELIKALGGDRILLGFAGAAGYREGHVVRYIILSRHEQATTLGELSGHTTSRLRQVADAFRGAGFPVDICPNMDAWLKTHAAEIIPVASAFYMAGSDMHRLARTHDAMVLMIRAIREGYKVLRALGIPITPATHRVFNWIPQWALVVLMRRMLVDKTAGLKIGHADAARDEMKLLADEFSALARKTSVPTPAMDTLYTYTVQAAKSHT